VCSAVIQEQCGREAPSIIWLWSLRGNHGNLPRTAGSLVRNRNRNLMNKIKLFALIYLTKHFQLRRLLSVDWQGKPWVGESGHKQPSCVQRSYHTQHSPTAGIPTYARPRATSILSYELAGRRVVNEDSLLKRHGSLLQMPLMTHMLTTVHITCRSLVRYGAEVSVALGYGAVWFRRSIPTL
jgi:hypothetical protein